MIPFAVYVLFRRPRDGRWWRSVLAVWGVRAFRLSLWRMRNQAAFGAFWKTGYSISGEQTGFGLGYFVRHAIPYLVMLLVVGVALVFPVGVKGMVELCKRPETRNRRGGLLAGLVVPITLLYMAYYWGADSMSMRFLLPTFALYTIAAVWLLKIRSEIEPQRAQKWAKIVLGVSLVWGLTYSVLVLRHLKQDNQMLAEITREIEQRVEPGSVLIAQSGLLQHLDFLGDWRLAPEEAFDRQARRPRPMGPREGPPRGPAARSSRGIVSCRTHSELPPRNRPLGRRYTKHLLADDRGENQEHSRSSGTGRGRIQNDSRGQAVSSSRPFAWIRRRPRPGGPRPGPGGFFFGLGGPPPGPGGPSFAPGGPASRGRSSRRRGWQVQDVRWTVSPPPLSDRRRRMAS